MGSPLTLRQIRHSDRHLLWQWRNSERIRSVSFQDGEIPASDHDRWFERTFLEMRDRKIMVQWHDVPVGWFQIESWDEARHKGEWGIALGAPGVTPGLGRMMPILVLGHAFERLGAVLMRGRVLDTNIRMLDVVRRLGLREMEEHEQSPRGDRSTAGIVSFETAIGEWSVIRDRALSQISDELADALAGALAAPVIG